MPKRILPALLGGTAVTLLLFGIAYTIRESNESLAHVVYWQGWWLQTFIPCMNIGTPENTMCEGTPLNMVVFFLGIPFGVVVYSLAAYVLLWLRQRVQ